LGIDLFEIDPTIAVESLDSNSDFGEWLNNFLSLPQATFRLSLGRHILCMATLLLSTLAKGTNASYYPFSFIFNKISSGVLCRKVIPARDTVGSAAAL
jgi:hypothetical protein